MPTKTINLPRAYPLQKQIEDDPHRFRVIACGRRWGKSYLAMREAFQMMLRRYDHTGTRQRGWVVSPTFPLVREDWLIAETVLKDAIITKHQTDMRMDFGAFGFMEFKSAERDDEGLRGAGIDFCIVDEASRVSRKAWEQGLRPALSDKQGRAVFISTPKGKNWFYDMFRKGQEGNGIIKSWQYPTYTNPRFPKEEWNEIVKTTPTMILKQEYLAEFLEDEASVFKNIDKCLRGAITEPKTGEEYTIGLDLGRAEDFTVAVVIRNRDCQVVNLYRQNEVDWSLQKKQVVALARRYNDALLYVDSTGIGDPIEEDLRKSGLKTRNYHFTNQSKYELVEQLMVGIEQGLLGIPDCEQTKFMIEELKAFTYEVLPTGRLRYSAPEGLHDDGVMALGLATMGISYRFYKTEPRAVDELPKMSPAWLEKRAFEKDVAQNMSLPRRLRQRIPELSFS
jgi:hypothetical protein